jgi:hypothetical protein
VLQTGRRRTSRTITSASGLKPLAKSISQMNRLSIARNAMKDAKIRTYILGILKTDIHREMNAMCAISRKCVLRQKSKKSIACFSWDKVYSELLKYAPTLHSVLKACVEVKRPKRPRLKPGIQIVDQKKRNVIVISMCGAIFLRNKNMHMNLFQKVVSLLLHSGHASKQVSICWTCVPLH